jgi:hypothetical protein
VSADLRFTARESATYNTLAPAQREEFHRLTDAGQPVPAALYAARQILTDTTT